MLLYDWRKIFECAEGNPSDIVLIVRVMSEGLIPKNRYDNIYKYYTKDFRGHSFLAHDDVLLFNRYKHTSSEVAQYIALASLRSLAEYYAYKTTTLNLLHCPVDRELFNNNSLLRVEDDTLHFIYEEVPKEKH